MTTDQNDLSTNRPGHAPGADAHAPQGQASVQSFRDFVAEYREAREVLDIAREGSATWQRATLTVSDLAHRTFTLTLPCMLGCGDTLTHDITIADYADLTYPPRGICGHH
ncbi:hypothetical protein [Nocardioides sp. Leaf285]|uniref:hypothetical protein n=1 Tax=Nocardioides sp. Leaf285 TaxID=1736322 RepID=UPI0007038B0C|nr:hypothetical protein [Nocardioides sp. Leaf285]KQP62891.1 hypothetical protein ASF47_17925 [Nocardioides sp. Leaf285]